MPNETLTLEQKIEAAQAYPSLWVEQNEIKNEVGFPIEFKKRKFLIDIYNDLSPYQAILKPPQVGCTVLFTLKSFYVAGRLKRQIIYTLPAQSDVQEMVGGSINRIIAQNPVLMNLVKDHDTVEQKQVGEAMIFYRGTFTAKQAMMIPSGLNIHDEVDASDAQIITQYENRLQAQEDGGWRWYFSHPTLAGHGVDIYWQKSNKREWYIKCKNKHEQVLEWPHNIDLQREIYICKVCNIEIEDRERINGAWRATAEGDFSGYHISQLMLYNKSAKDIIKAFNDPQKDKQYFYNYVLGLPYIGSEDRIEPSVVLKNCTDVPNDYYDPKDMVFIGGDTGLGIHYVMMNSQGAFFYDNPTEITATKSPYDAIREKLYKFDGKNGNPYSIALLDKGGELQGSVQLQAEFPGRVFLCTYQHDRKSADYVQWGKDDNYGIVKIDRNRQMTLMIEQIRDIGRLRLSGPKEEWAEFASHFGNIYREKIIVDSKPGKDDKSLLGNEYVWKRNGADHYVHALLYAMVGYQRFATEKGKVFGQRNALSGIPRGQMVEDGGVQLIWPK
jgi:Phage terminase large subunit (GpA)